MKNEEKIILKLLEIDETVLHNKAVGLLLSFRGQAKKECYVFILL
jgi:hypothetical protein